MNLRSNLDEIYGPYTPRFWIVGLILSCHFKPHSLRKPQKFIAESDDVNILRDFLGKVDENVCLYRGYVMLNSHMNDGLLTEFNLQPTCDTMPESNTTPQACWNTLRFTDIENSTNLYGIDNRVTCKLCFWHQYCINYALKSMRFNKFYIFIKLSIHHTNQKLDYLVDK